MQSKISSFFKPSSTSAQSCQKQSPPRVVSDEDDELAVWENTQHQFFNTYKRRTSNSGNGEKTSYKSAKPISRDVSLRPEPMGSGRALNKKRSYAQLHLDLGQPDFNFRACSTCGINYVPGDKEDENAHKAFHKNYTHGIQFKILKNERIVHVPCTEGGRIVLVLDSDAPALRNKVQDVIKMMEIEFGTGWIFHKLCKVYLLVCSHRVAGCLVAEPIKEAFRVLSYSVREGSAKGSISNSATLQFGQIIFQREAKRKATSNSVEALNQDHEGVIVCEEASAPAVCGIRAIWVSPSNRRKRIASQLLEAVRRSFCTGFALEQSQLAFSPPNSAGKELASSFTGTSSFLVYRPKFLGSSRSIYYRGY